MKTPVTNPTPDQANALLAFAPKTHTRKTVEWSYPSSPNAVKAGFARQGCFTLSVETPSGKGEPFALCAFTDRAQALATARAVNLPWAYSFLQCYPQEAT